MSKLIYYQLLCGVLVCTLIVSTPTTNLNIPVEQKEGIVLLTDSNFDDFLAKHKHAIVSIFDPWCGHCQKFSKLFIEIANQFNEDDGVDVIFAQLDSVVNTKTTHRFEVEEFPTLIWFHEGKSILFEGEKEKDDIITFLRIHADPEYIPPADVTISLSAQNFSAGVNVNISLVMFYAPWCGHSKKMKPFLEKGAKELVGILPVYKIDGTQEKILVKKYKVGRFPQLNIFRKGFIYEYNGPRKDGGIGEYMKTQLGEASTHLKNMKQYHNFPSTEKVTVIGYLDNSKRKREMFFRIANRLRDDYIFGHIDDADIAEEAYIYNRPSITIIIPALFPTDKGNQILTIPFSKNQEKMEDAITNLKLPLVGKYSGINSKYYKSKLPIVYAFYKSGKQTYEFCHSKLVKIAQNYKNKLTFTLVDMKEFKDEVIRYRHDDSSGDLHIGMKIKDGFGKHHKMPVFQELDEDEVNAFIEAVLKGTHAPVFKSQPIPSHRAPDGEVVTYVSDNLLQELREPRKDKLLFVYADWCEKCKKVFEHVKRIAVMFDEIDDLVIAKYDYVANELPLHSIEKMITHFPSFLYVKSADVENLIKYKDKSNQLKTILKFINEHATVNLGSVLRDEL